MSRRRSRSSQRTQRKKESQQKPIVKTLSNGSIKEVGNNDPVASQRTIDSTHLVTSRQVKLSQTEQFSGPIPPPILLEGYEKIVPGSADRIIKLMEKQQDHRINLETKVTNQNISNSKKGLIFAFILAILLILLSGYALYLGRSLEGLAIVITEIGVLVGIFLKTNSDRKKELEKHSKNVSIKDKRD